MPPNNSTHKKEKGHQLGEDKVKVIIQMRRAGVMPTPIAQSLDVNVESVYTILKKAKKGQETYKKRPGRNPKLNEREKRLLARQIEKAPMLSIKKHHQVWNDAQTNINYKTFRIYLKSMGCRSDMVA
ncbi:unnamed protein product [Mucor fragilis]